MEFNFITWDDYEKIQDCYKMCMQPCSDSSFLSLMEMAINDVIEVAFNNNMCWIKRIEDGHETWLPPIGEWDEVDWETLLKENVPAGTEFTYIPEYLLKRWNSFSLNLEISDMREEWDYVYDLRKQTELTGSRYADYRRAVRKFQKQYSYTFEPINVENIDELIVFQDKWMQDHQGTERMNEELFKEDIAFRKMIKMWDKFPNAIGHILRVDGKIVCYVISENLNGFVVSGRFAKADIEYPAAQKFAKYMAYLEYRKDFMLCNAGGDANLEGLRQCKMQENPITLYKKFRVIWKG